MDITQVEIEQLKEICKLKKVRWAIWGQNHGTTWQWGPAYGLSKTRRSVFYAYLQDHSIQNWLAGALSTGRIRTRHLKDQATAFGCQYLYLFPHPASQSILLVGAEQLPAETRRFLRILALGRLPVRPLAVDDAILPGELPTDLDTGLSYDLASALERILALCVRALPCDAAGIALRYGEQTRLEAVWNLPGSLVGWQVSVADSAILSQMVTDRQMIQVADAAAGIPCPLFSEQNAWQGAWVGLPLRVGRRVIGIAYFLSQRPGAFPERDLHQVKLVAAYLAPSIETSVALAEASHHLEKFALLNEIASAASVGEDTAEVARRIVRRLRRIFATDLVSILLLTPDGRFLKEFGQPSPRIKPLTVPVESSLSGHVVESGLPIRIGELSEAPRYLALTEGVQSELTVPLKYRGVIIGALNLESRETNAFSLRDEQLLVVMASQLAGLIENVRLHEETRKRARNLELIHQVFEQVVGLGDIGEIARRAAELMAERFSYELAAIMLLDPRQAELVLLGIGGSDTHGIQIGHRQPITVGIVGQVFRSGHSWMVNDVDQEPLYHEHPGWQPGSEMCVPLRDGGQVIGVVNVERMHKDAFVENDLLALEALAGVLSSVIGNARSYQRLRANLRRLQAVRETALDISADVELETLLERVTERARELVGADGAELGLVDEARQVVQVKVSLNPWDEYQRGLEIPFGQGVAGQMAVSGEPVAVDDYLSWSGRLKLGTRPPFTAVAGVPLKYKGQVIGTLTISHDQAGTGFDPEDIQLLELLAPQVAVFVRNARLYQELQ
ncbi:MAG: GAF domain-containing protein, partial [Anaerolineales bacterium]|nr:GAF domain-containing protein [Anaerolineales bacterium]